MDQIIIMDVVYTTSLCLSVNLSVSFFYLPLSFIYLSLSLLFLSLSLFYLPLSLLFTSLSLFTSHSLYLRPTLFIYVPLSLFTSQSLFLPFCLYLPLSRLFTSLSLFTSFSLLTLFNFLPFPIYPLSLSIYLHFDISPTQTLSLSLTHSHIFKPQADIWGDSLDVLRLIRINKLPKVERQIKCPLLRCQLKRQLSRWSQITLATIFLANTNLLIWSFKSVIWLIT